MSVDPSSSSALDAPELAAPPQRRRKVSYEVFDNENADGGPTPAPDQQHHQDHPRKRQRLAMKEQRRLQQLQEDGVEEEEEVAPTWDHNADGYDDLELDGDSARTTNRSSVETEARGQQLLPVAELGPDFDGNPISGAEYLAVVRREARAAARFTRAPNPYDRSNGDPNHLGSTSHSPIFDQNTPDISSSSVNRYAKDLAKRMNANVPDEHYREYALARFRAMRALYEMPVPDWVSDPFITSPLPEEGDRTGWFRFIHNQDPPPGFFIRSSRSRSNPAAQAQELYSFDIAEFASKGRAPTPNICRRLTQPQIRYLITLIAECISRFTFVAQDHTVNAITATRDVITRLHAVWLWSLLLFLDSHLVSDHLNELRSTARILLEAINLDRLSIKRDLHELERLRERKAKQEGARLQRNEEPEGESEGQDGDDLQWDDDYHQELYELCTDRGKHTAREQGAWRLFIFMAMGWGQLDLLEEAENLVTPLPA
ncbi:hypothetical protein OC846_001895 [Tilletia horrida]|uniref:Uncharacterized protein n=1 Tax=Tilletia horrida TaxID=155126 RepID=A0AAN6GV61_9BASI|nr:hypothetical protein OC846_001895 [Tilletia horrida]KAK0568344.1 hypothetical protein OC861_002056 [Tilletia horrida]